MSWLAPPVRTTRPRGSAANGEAASRSRTISRISSTRGLMMRTSFARETNCGASRSSSSTGGTAIMSRSSDAAGEHAAVERLDALGIGDTGIEAAREIHGDVLAAEREAVGMHEAAAGEHRHGGRAGAHVDHGGAEIGLVVGQRGKPGHIRARHHRLDVEMAALDRQHQVARGRSVGGHDVHVDAESARQHAARVADAAARRRARSRSAANAARRGRRARNGGCRR